MFLTPQELHDLTGYVQPAAQIRWLQKNAIEHYVRSDGKPRVPSPVRRSTGPAKAGPSPRFEAIAGTH